MSALQSTLLYMSVNGSVVACGRAVGHTRNLGYIDTTCQDSGGHQTGIGGLLSGSTSLTAVASDAGADFTYPDFKALQKSKSIVTLVIGGLQVGDEIETVSGLITSVELSGGDPEGLQEYNIEVQHTGEEVPGTVT